MENYCGKELHDFVDNYVVFDVETTGLSPSRNHMIEIGGVRIEDGQVVDTFSEFIKSHEPLPEEIVALTGITDAMLDKARPEEDVVRSFSEFIGDTPLVAHNADFDIGFLSKSYGRFGLGELKNDSFCTLKTARAVYPNLEHHSMKYLTSHFGIDPGNAHRALDDCFSENELLNLMVHEVKRSGKTLGDYYKSQQPRLKLDTSIEELHTEPPHNVSPTRTDGHDGRE